jgi:hypothetical protein
MRVHLLHCFLLARLALEQKAQPLDGKLLDEFLDFCYHLWPAQLIN